MIRRLTLTQPLSLVLSFLASLMVLTGCPDDPPPGDDGGSRLLEIGTGCVGQFVPFEDDEELALVRGPQGGQHVQVSVRAGGLDTQPALVSMRLQRVSDGVTVSIPLQVRLRFEAVDGQSYEELTGINLVVPVPDDALGQDLLMFVRVAENDPDGALVEGMRPITLEWKAPPCGALRGDAGRPLDLDAGAADADVAGDAG